MVAMSNKIAFIAGNNYRHYLFGLEKNLVREGFVIEYFDEEAFCAARDVAGFACLLTVHSIDEKLMRTLRGLQGTVPTVTLQDGIVEYSHCCMKDKSFHRYRPVATDVLLVFGERTKRIITYRSADSTVIVTGSPRFDDYHRYRGAPPAKDEPLLVTTANTPWYDKGSKKAFSNIFIDLLKTLADMKLTFRLRLPDKVKKELYFSSPYSFNKLLKSKFLHGISSKDTPLIDDIVASSAVITTPSTVALEAMILDRPTAILQTAHYPMFLESAFHLATRESLRPVLTSLVSDDDDFTDRMNFQNVIRDENVIADGRATERVVDIIKDLVK